MGNEVSGQGKPRIMLPRVLRPKDEAPPAKAGPAPRERPFPWKVVVLVALAAGGGLYLLNRMAEDTKVQDCVMAGHKNCVKRPLAGEVTALRDQALAGTGSSATRLRDGGRRDVGRGATIDTPAKKVGPEVRHIARLRTLPNSRAKRAFPVVGRASFCSFSRPSCHPQARSSRKLP